MCGTKFTSVEDENMRGTTLTLPPTFTYNLLPDETEIDKHHWRYHIIDEYDRYYMSPRKGTTDDPFLAHEYTLAEIHNGTVLGHLHTLRFILLATDEYGEKPTAKEKEEVPAPVGDDDKFVMLDFLYDLEQYYYQYKEERIQVVHLHSFPANLNYANRLGTLEGHNPQLLFPLLLTDAFGSDDGSPAYTVTRGMLSEERTYGWDEQYKKFLSIHPPEGWERGITNRVIAGGRTMYVPMFDMKGKYYAPEQLKEAFGRKFYDKNYQDISYVFETDSSYHVYVPDLLTEQEWRELMLDSLIPVNPTGSLSVDTRWVGHALLQGFTAIRVSNFTKTVIPFAVHRPENKELIRRAGDLPF